MQTIPSFTNVSGKKIPSAEIPTEEAIITANSVLKLKMAAIYNLEELPRVVVAI